MEALKTHLETHHNNLASATEDLMDFEQDLYSFASDDKAEYKYISFMNYHTFNNFEDTASNLTPLQKLLFDYVYYLYCKIFHSTGHFDRPLYQHTNFINNKISTTQHKLSEMDVNLSAWYERCERLRELGNRTSYYNSFVYNLDNILIRYDVKQYINKPMLLSVYAAYDSEVKTYYIKSDKETILIRKPSFNSHFNYTGYGFTPLVISTKNVPDNLPLFWRFIFAITAGHLDREFIDITENTVNNYRYTLHGAKIPFILADFAAPISIRSMYDHIPTRSVTNILASYFSCRNISYTDNYCDRTLLLQIISGAVLGKPYKLVDGEYYKLLLDKITYLTDIIKGEFNIDLSMGIRDYYQDNLVTLRYLNRQFLTNDTMDPANIFPENNTRYFYALEAEDDDNFLNIKDDDEETSQETDPPEEENTEENENNNQEKTPDSPEQTENTIEGNGTPEENEVDDSFIIQIDQQEGTTKSLLYRMSVLQLYNKLKTLNSQDVDADNLSVFENWCAKWLWLVTPNTTSVLLKTLGFNKHLTPLFKEKELQK